MISSFSIATNVSLADWRTIRHTIPSWLRIFGDQVSEVVLIIDTQRSVGRIADLHGRFTDLDTLLKEVERLKRLDDRIRASTILSEKEMKKLLKKWFKKSMPIRCQAGTPIAAFIQAVEESEAEMVLRCDSDMLFFENGWLGKAANFFEEGIYDLIEPPHLGFRGNQDSPVSTRAFLIQPHTFAKTCLPMKAHRLDCARRVHRCFHGRPTWLALEQMFSLEKTRGKLRHCILNEQLGFSLHIPNRSSVMIPGFENIVSNVECGRVPESQRMSGMNFNPSKWPPVFWKSIGSEALDHH